MTHATIAIDAFGDPNCPWDFSAEPSRLRLLWRYRDAVRITHRMVVLSRTREEYAERGITLQQLAGGRAMLRDRFGQPIDATPKPRHVATVNACRAVVAVRCHQPGAATLMLRRLRVLGMSEALFIDEPEVIARAATESGLDPATVDGWMADAATEAALQADMDAARDPAPTALAMPERLAPTPGGGQRYTCPSYIMVAGDRRLDGPGFQPARVYEVLAANLAPQVTPHPEPTCVQEVLEWAPYPLSTAEVAGVMELPVDAARTMLTESGARREPAAGDAYWSVAGA